MHTLKHLSFYFILISFMAFSPRSEAQELKNDSKSPTVFYLIRHAEKDRSNGEVRDPELTERGRLRAEYWKSVFKEVPFDVVYSTNYARTKQTAAPVAREKGLEITLYQPGHPVADEWIKSHQGKHILVVGHSNTIPELVNDLLGEKKYEQIEDTNNANLYIVTLSEEQRSSILLQPEPTNTFHKELP